MLKRRSLRSRIAQATFVPLSGSSQPPNLCRWIGLHCHPLSLTTIAGNELINLLHPFRQKRQNGPIMYAVVFDTHAALSRPASEPITITSRNNGDNPCDRTANGDIQTVPSAFPTRNGALNCLKLLQAFCHGKQDRSDHGTETEAEGQEDLVKSGQVIQAKTQISQTRTNRASINPIHLGRASSGRGQACLGSVPTTYYQRIKTSTIIKPRSSTCLRYPTCLTCPTFLTYPTSSPKAYVKPLNDRKAHRANRTACPCTYT